MNKKVVSFIVVMIISVVVLSVIFSLIHPNPDNTGSISKISTLKIGGTVLYGTYPQTKEGTDETPIEWIVLEYDEVNHRALLLSKYGLDAKPYNAQQVNVTWETCSLRTWLNNDFLNRAFTAEEQSAILLTDVDNSSSQGYSGWNTSEGNNTQDNIFLLSCAEAKRCFEVEHQSISGSDQNTVSRVAPTGYAIQQGSWTYNNMTADEYAAGWWWLRSPGHVQSCAAGVGSTGSLCDYYVNLGMACVRPALWIDLECAKIETKTITPATASLAPKETATPMPELTVTPTSEPTVTPSQEPTESPAPTQSPVPTPTSFVTANVCAGDTIRFGKYEQDADSSNGPEDIEWIVLDVSDGKVLLISRYGLDAKPYNTEDTDCTWETCSLRFWLNNDFFQTAFNSKEQTAILLTDVDNGYDQGRGEWSTSGGKDTQDRVFLLSCTEANNYLNVSYSLSLNTAPRLTPTAYALEQGAQADSDYKTDDGSAAAWWWLRSPGSMQWYAAFVDSYGSLYSRDVGRKSGCIRPTMWVDLDVIGGDVVAVGTETVDSINDREFLQTVGSIVSFGRYPQTEEGTDETQIEWIVLEYDETNHRALLLSKYGLDAKPYNTEYIDVTWETCSLRAWLNNDFLNRAFTAEEQSAVLLTDVDNSSSQGYSGWSTSGGNNTQDRIFLLSCAEAIRYFGVEPWETSKNDQNTASRVALTAYAIQQGAYISSSYNTTDGCAAGWWWLRSPGYEQIRAALVTEYGSLHFGEVRNGHGCIRPAMWINLDAIFR